MHMHLTVTITITIYIKTAHAKKLWMLLPRPRRVLGVSSSVQSRPFTPTLPNTMTSGLAPPAEPFRHRPPNGQGRRHP
jgi:hypothetical protein